MSTNDQTSAPAAAATSAAATTTPEPATPVPAPEQPRRPGRRRRRGIVTAIATLAALGTLTIASGSPAQASVASTGGTVTSGASCNRYNHTLTMQGGIILSTRFPKGAPIASRYAYYYVNGSQQRTSVIYVTGWLYSTASPSTIYIPPTALGGDITIPNNTSWLPSYTINTWGQIKVMTQVGVWNGSAYEYSGWDTATSYDNYGQFGIYSSNSVCLGSVT